MKTVCIVQPRLHHFRVPFYVALKEELSKRNVCLILIHGQPNLREKQKMDSGFINWAIQVTNHRIKIMHTEFIWQPCLRNLWNCDLAIVQHWNSLLINYLLLLTTPLIVKRVAVWGHGKNCQSAKPNGVKEKWKRLWIKKPDWWFAYTDFTKDILLKTGYPADMITVVQNSIDSAQLSTYRDDIKHSELVALRKKLEVKGDKVGVFCGSLASHKGIAFIIEAARIIRKEVKGFELIMIGTGPDAHLVERVASVYPWFHHVGAKFGREKILHMKLGDVFLMPKGLGLAILDAFVMQLPVLTTKDGLHGPEISYLKDGMNGYITANTVEDYATAVIRVLSCPKKLKELSSNCRKDAEVYTMTKMVQNFADGVIKCLSSEI